VFPTPERKAWTTSGFRDRVWVRAVEAARNDDVPKDGGTSVFEGFTFHLLRHTAASLMALSGMDAAVIAERMHHTDGGALLLKKYNHLYPAQKRTQAARLDALIQAFVDEKWTQDPRGDRDRTHHEGPGSGQYWDRTSDPSRVKRVLSR